MPRSALRRSLPNVLVAAAVILLAEVLLVRLPAWLASRPAPSPQLLRVHAPDCVSAWLAGPPAPAASATGSAVPRVPAARKRN